MDTVWRAAAVYIFLLVLFRLTGRRSLHQMTTFDLVLLLIVGEAAQPALLGNDFSLTTAGIAIVTLLMLDVGFSLLKREVPLAEKILDGQPTVLVVRGVPLTDQIRRARVDEGEILQSARERHGILAMKDIGLAALEVGGAISIVPQERLAEALLPSAPGK